MKTNVDNIPGPVEPRDEYVVKLPVILALYTILHIGMIVTGFYYQDACPVDPQIPLFLILQGIFGLLSRSFGSVRYVITHKDWFFIFLVISSFLYVAELIVFFLGSFWVYKEAMPSFNEKDTDRYCHKGTYLFAFCYISIMYSLMIFAAFFLCCALCLAPSLGINKVAQTKPWQIVVI
ncbi:transmembrane protein 272-like [Coccinella septempunctata]|uniref:transmembrane protein 272-like n=1 Tax=Coccinella septempunctata TaxID=41139 RepID=UPI001D08E7A7|nr:transmembrane protein 272-like [Coccinella septempunctata]